MRKYQVLHLIALVVTCPLMGLMLATRLRGVTGVFTDLAILILLASSVWHVVALQRAARRVNC